MSGSVGWDPYRDGEHAEHTGGGAMTALEEDVRTAEDRKGFPSHSRRDTAEVGAPARHSAITASPASLTRAN
jgi:hypothetical protein